jgi:hypothetical protein
LQNLLYCKRCGKPLTGQEEVCPSCGLPIAESKPAETAPSRAETVGPKGVSGWLLVLCVLLAIVFPLNTIYATAMSLRYHPDVTVLLLNATNVGLAILSLVAGVMLWRIRKSGVNLAKIFFLLTPLHALGILYLVVSNLHALQASVTVLMAIRILAFPFLLSIIWYRYLVESKRVKNTYGTG